MCNASGGSTRGRLESVRAAGRQLAGERYRETSTPEDLAAVLDDLGRQTRPVLCIIGGDGTLQAVLSALVATTGAADWPTLAVLPGGTANLTANDLGSGGPLLKALGALLERQRGGTLLDHVVRRSVLKIEREGEAPLAGMFFGAGAAAAGIQHYRRRLEAGSLLKDRMAVFTVAHVLRRLAMGHRGRRGLAQRVRWSVDGRPQEDHQSLLYMVSTLNRLVLGTRPFWGEKPGPIHLTVVEETAEALWWRLPRLARGRPGRVLRPEGGYHSLNGHRLVLWIDDRFVLDGEVFSSPPGGGPLTFTPLEEVEWVIP